MALEIYLILAAAIFCIGLCIVLIKKNTVMVLMGIELMLNAVNLNFIGFSQFDQNLMQGQFFILFILVIAAAEAAVGLAIVLNLYNHFKSADIREAKTLQG
jgi:NADH:ubiquinone oxidoreductase subunit K